MPSKQDEHFHKQALELAHKAAMAIEEAYQYCEDIEDNELREETEKSIDKIIEWF